MVGCFVLYMLMGRPSSLFVLIFILDVGCITVLISLV